MVILGVDPGSIVTGYGVIRKSQSVSYHLESGTIKLKKTYTQSKRISFVYDYLNEVIERFQPDTMVVESLFHGENSQSLIKLSQIRGAILLLGEQHGLEIAEYAPMEIKKGITGFGRAEKSQMLYMIQRMLQLPDLKSLDEADALAMALYHSNMCGPIGSVGAGV